MNTSPSPQSSEPTDVAAPDPVHVDAVTPAPPPATVSNPDRASSTTTNSESQSLLEETNLSIREPLVSGSAVELALEPTANDLGVRALAFPLETWQPLAPQHLAMEHRTAWILEGLLALIGIAVSVGLGLGLGWLHPGAWIPCCAFLVVLAILGWTHRVWVPRSHRATHWMLSERGIEIRKGVWWRHCLVIPKSRIQHTDLRQGPVLRAYGLATLVVYTAGTEHAEIELTGLSMETAQQVRDQLMEGSLHPSEGV